MRALAAVSLTLLVACSHKKDLTCRWVNDPNPKAADLVGADPQVALTDPWTGFELPLKSATVCLSTPKEVRIIYKPEDTSNNMPAAIIAVRQALKAKGYADTGPDPQLSETEMDEYMSAGKTEIEIRGDAFPEESWNGHPFVVHLQARTSQGK